MLFGPFYTFMLFGVEVKVITQHLKWLFTNFSERIERLKPAAWNDQFYQSYWERSISQILIFFSHYQEEDESVFSQSSETVQQQQQQKQRQQQLQQQQQQLQQRKGGKHQPRDEPTSSDTEERSHNRHQKKVMFDGPSSHSILNQITTEKILFNFREFWGNWRFRLLKVWHCSYL